MDKPTLIPGNLVIDDRGSVSFINDFTFAGIKRFYQVTNHRQGFVRAWHGHRHEAKVVTVARGAALVGAVKIDDWVHPSPSLQPEKFILSAAKPAALHLPPGFANGFMTLTPDAILIFYSTASLEESKNDDIRWPARQWDIWEIEER